MKVYVLYVEYVDLQPKIYLSFLLFLIQDHLAVVTRPSCSLRDRFPHLAWCTMNPAISRFYFAYLVLTFAVAEFCFCCWKAKPISAKVRVETCVLIITLFKVIFLNYCQGCFTVVWRHLHCRQSMRSCVTARTLCPSPAHPVCGCFLMCAAVPI